MYRILSRVVQMARRDKAAALAFRIVVLFFTLSSTSIANDSMNQTQLIRNGETLVSSGSRFVLGFFSPGSSKNRYLGIWYSFSNQTVIWVANRQTPITDSTGVLKLKEDGDLILVYRNNRTVWSTGTTTNTSSRSTSVLQLFESGNLVVKGVATDGSSVQLWQSFDHPTDTLLPGMKFGLDLRTGHNRFLTSWKGNDDPSPGNHLYVMDPQGRHEIYVREEEPEVIAFRVGPWNGVRFSGMPPSIASSSYFDFRYVSNQDEVYYVFEASPIITNTITRLTIAPSGRLQRFVWMSNLQTWQIIWTAPNEGCDHYASCGANGVCETGNLSPKISCQCNSGFEPKSWSEWHLGRYGLGCIRKGKLSCDAGEGFKTVKGVKLPDISNSTVSMNMSLSECKNACQQNCSCIAYAAADISTGSEGTGCIMWFGDLIDTKALSDGQDLYLRVPASEIDKTETSDTQKKRNVVIPVGVLISAGMILLGACGLLVWKRRKHKREMERGKRLHNTGDISKWKDELPLFDFDTVASMTEDFSSKNRIGEGGFGSVYKGRMGDGQEIAVKRLSLASRQGLDEFMNEVILISKLQHRNLVRLLGCCAEGEERILIYEYMQNKSLDAFIFDESKRALLDWKKRVSIVIGIARGLVYLHQDSRFRIIHRDLKAGNILLDGAMNPKISDFGTARIFGAEQMEENTRRIIGTYGYMSPEYAMDGIFSEKSDVFSFGVLLLEIISGRKNRALCHEEEGLNLLALAWRLWKDDRALELVDETLAASCPPTEVLRCIQIGLSCVEECAADRPTMSSVVFMLSNETSLLPGLKRPGFWEGRGVKVEETLSSTGQSASTANELTLTQVEGR